jgi:transcriptional regulator with XRE-family HTH domain
MVVSCPGDNPATNELRPKEKWQQHMASGELIQELREARFVKTRDVERISRTIASIKRNPDFYVSHSTLADIENGSVPSIHKLFSLAVCFNVSLEELLVVFGIDAKEVTPFLVESDLGVESSEVPARKLSFPPGSDAKTQLSSDETTLLRLNPQELAAFLPTPLRPHDLRRYRYAVIGLKDDTMGELIPPGSVVEIDIMQNVVQLADWKKMRDRPIYLVWHTEGHSCCWCHLEGKDLTVLPYPISRQPIRHFKVPREACVIGRVTKAWLPFSSTVVGRWQEPVKDDKEGTLQLGTAANDV